MALMMSRKKSGQATNVGATLTIVTATISSSTHIIRGLIDLSTNAGTTENVLYSNTNPVTVGDYAVHHAGSSTNWETYIKTAVACDVYKNGTKIGTTTPDVDFALGLNIINAGVSATVVAIPV